VGKETCWDAEGRVCWQWEHRGDGSSLWTQYWPDGRTRSQSVWRGHLAHGPAKLWDQTGSLVSQREFKDGVLLA
jgi:antitoxin component YwqK of YwqJK toxin-antitoxin module